MRFFSFILIVLTLLLSSSPCCEGDECCDETDAACSENAVDNHHSEESANSCSPFMVCGSCNGFVVIADNPDLNSESEVTNNQNIPYIQLYLVNYNLKFWQPPKIS